MLSLLDPVPNHSQRILHPLNLQRQTAHHMITFLWLIAYLMEEDDRTCLNKGALCFWTLPLAFTQIF